MSLKKLFYGLCVVSALVGCADAGSSDGSLNSGLNTPPVDNNPPPPATAQSACPLKGSFERCSANGLLGSVREILTFSDDGQLNSKFETYLLSPTCTGVPSLVNSVVSSLNLGALGGSDSILGATNVDLTAGLGDLGCGLGLTSFTAIHLSEDCMKLGTSANPGCDPNDRGVSLDANLFDRVISVDTQ